MTELSYYNDLTEDWESKEFESQEAAERWLDSHHPDTYYAGNYRCFNYIKCARCGAMVQLSGFTNTCDCGADYNGFGQLLASRDQWGEETGESLADILAVDNQEAEAAGYEIAGVDLATGCDHTAFISADADDGGEL